MRRTLSLSTSILALVCCGAAHAQVQSSQSSASNGTIETVVVTAERRSEDLQKTAIAADVVTGQDLQNRGVATIDSLQFIAPSVAVDNFGQGGDVDIRGIGKGEHNAQTGTGVITYRDDVPTFPGYILEEPYYDISDIQILRGPQGTFVGENSTGGAIFVKTNDPVIGGGYTGYAQVQYGNYNDGAVQGAINIPISDTLAARIATYDEERDSFYSITDTDPADNCPGDKYAGCKPGYNPGDVRWATTRFSLLWQPSDALTVLWKTDADYLDNGGYPAAPFYDLYKNFPGTSTPNPYYADLFHITANAPNSGLDDFVRSDLKVEYQLPDGIKFRSVSGYQVASTKYSTDLDGTSYGNPYDGGAADDFFTDHVNERLLTEEVDVISPDKGPVTWVVGGFAQNNTYDYLKPYQFQIVTPPPQGFGTYALQGATPYDSLAGFGQVSLNLSDAIQLQFGARYSYNKETNKNDDIYQYGLLLVDNQSTKSYNTSYKVSFNWTLDDNNFAYAFISTGYKPGGLNVPVAVGVVPAPFGAETVTSYETGWKATWLDGHLRTQFDTYYNDYNNFQVTIGYPLEPIFGFEVNDPNTTKIYGVEGEAEASFGAFSFTAGLGLMHSELGTFYATDPRIATFTPCLPESGPSSASCIDLAKHPQTYAPDFTFNLGAQYIFPLNDSDTLTPRLSFGHESGQWATLFDNRDLGDRLGARNLLGAQLAWQRGDYVFTLYGTNLTDQHYVAALNSGFDFAGAPRQFGIRLSTAF